MHWGSALRRVTSGLFVVAVIALLVVPVGSAARLPQAQTTAGSAQSKAVAPAARAHQAITHVNPADHLQHDAATPPDLVDEPRKVEPETVDQFSQSLAEGRRGDPTVRGPPAL